MSSSSIVRFLSRRCYSTNNSAAGRLGKFKYTLSVRTEFYPSYRPLARAKLYNPKHQKIAEEVFRLQPMSWPILVEACSIEQCRAWVLENFRFIRYLRVESGSPDAVDFLNSDKILKMKQFMAKRAVGGGGIYQYYFNRAAEARGGEGEGGGGPIVAYAFKEEETEENKEASEGESDD